MKFSSDSELSPPPSDLDDDTKSLAEEKSKYFSSTSSKDRRVTPAVAAKPPLKRKRADTSETYKPSASTRRAISAVKKEESSDNECSKIKKEESTDYEGSKIKKEVKPTFPRSNGGPSGKTPLKKFSPPVNWRAQYDAIKEMRLRIPAVVDTMGCERLAEPESERITPKIQRFQTLIALVLSSQTKDTVTSAAMKRMQREMPGGLTVESILKLDERTIDDYIKQVGFHNKKAVFIKKIAQILVDQYDGDIPDTIEGMTSLPGVGPKMSYLCMAVAWKRVEGIGVDTHVHRISNLLKWVPNTLNPETTRAYLESWLPKELWHEINWLLVGFGQTICLPRGRRCWECSLGPKSVGGLGLCKAAVVPASMKVKVERQVKQEIKEEDDRVVIKAEEQEIGIHTKVKTEDSPAADILSASMIKGEPNEKDLALTELQDIEDIGAEQKVILFGKKEATKRSQRKKK